jgi:hypothetical protein
MTSLKESSSRKGRVCPWWLADTFDNPIRKLFHRPQKMLAPYFTAGMRYGLFFNRDGRDGRRQREDSSFGLTAEDA